MVFLPIQITLLISLPAQAGRSGAAPLGPMHVAQRSGNLPCDWHSGTCPGALLMGNLQQPAQRGLQSQHQEKDNIPMEEEPSHWNLFSASLLTTYKEILCLMLTYEEKWTLIQVYLEISLQST